MCRRAAEALDGRRGLRVTVEHDRLDYLTPRTVLSFGDDWRGPSRDDVRERLMSGSPRIRLFDIFDPWELAIDPLNLDDGELELVVERLIDVLDA